MPSRWMTLLSTLSLAFLGCGDDASGSGGGASRSASTSGAGGIGGAGGASGELGECGWEGKDPGDLVATGTTVGSVIANVQGLTDQCGKVRSLWDFAGGYRILVLAEGW